MKVRCVRLLDTNGRNTDADTALWVRLNATYQVLEIEISPERTLFRFIGEDRFTPALFRAEMFEVVGSVVPPTWVVVSSEPGHFTFTPRPWARPGFWTSYFDRENVALACFEEEKQKILAADP